MVYQWTIKSNVNLLTQLASIRSLSRKQNRRCLIIQVYANTGNVAEHAVKNWGPVYEYHQSKNTVPVYSIRQRSIKDVATTSGLCAHVTAGKVQYRMADKLPLLRKLQ